MLNSICNTTPSAGLGDFSKEGHLWTLLTGHTNADCCRAHSVFWHIQMKIWMFPGTCSPAMTTPRKFTWCNVLTFAKHIMNRYLLASLASHLKPNQKIWKYFWRLIFLPCLFRDALSSGYGQLDNSIGFSISKDQQGGTAPLLLSNWADRVNWRVVVFLWECWKDCLVSPSLQLQLLKTMSNQFALQECQVRFESNKLTKRTLYLRGPLDLQAWSDLRWVWIVGLQGQCYLLLSTTASFEMLSNIHSHFRQCDGCKGASGMISNPDWWSSQRLL